MNKKFSQFTFTVEALTPKHAKELLEGKYEGQRVLNQERIRKYALAMKGGNWLFDGMPIRVDWYGRLIDGQHRLNALVKWGGIIKKQVIEYGLDPDVYKVMDSGKTRCLGDALRRNQEKNYTSLASALMILSLYEKGTTLIGSTTYLETADALSILEANPGLRDSAAKSLIARHIFPTGPGTFLHYILSRIDPDEADVFFGKMATGEMLEQKNPILTLRNMLTVAKEGFRSATINREVRLAWAINAWNCFRKGQKATKAKLSWRETKASCNEPFPKPI